MTLFPYHCHIIAISFPYNFHIISMISVGVFWSPGWSLLGAALTSWPGDLQRSSSSSGGTGTIHGWHAPFWDRISMGKTWENHPFLYYKWNFLSYFYRKSEIYRWLFPSSNPFTIWLWLTVCHGKSRKLMEVYSWENHLFLYYKWENVIFL